ncbi:MAG: FtsX-like permease family protein [Rhodothermales bacterium]|nr:FtsX-like permease family protein [Rhodothermales bacterium]
MRPPRFWSGLLSWLVKDDWDTPLGDFEEYYHRMELSQGRREADRWYRSQVVALIPGRVYEKIYWSIHMFRNYLKVAVRSLRRRLFYTGVNVGGLAVAVAAVVLIVLFIRDEMTFDQMHDDHDRIARIVETKIESDGAEQSSVHTIGPLGPTMEQSLPEVTASLRMVSRWVVGRQTVQFGENRFYEGEYLLAEENFFDFFDFPMLAGNQETALVEPRSVVLTESAARKYFGDVDPMGRLLSFERMGDMTVTGLIEDPPGNSHLDFSMLLSFSTIMENDGWRDWAANWESSSFITYLMLDEGATAVAAERKVPAMLADQLDDEANNAVRVTVQPLSDIHFGSGWIEFDRNRAPSDRMIILMFAAIALFILLIASINYTNMATAASLGRGKEVGLRKTVGAERGQLVRQFLSESVLTAFVALLAGLTLAWLALPVFNDIAAKNLTLSPLANPWILPVVAGLVLVVGVLAGSYPAFILSSFDPVRVLKGADGRSGSSARIRKGLVVVQFALSMALIVSSLVVYRQLDYIQEKRLGFNEEQLVVVDINDGNSRANFAAMKDEFSRDADVLGVSVTSNVPGDWKNITQIDIGAYGAGEAGRMPAYFLAVDEDFLKTFEVELVSGRNFSGESGADSMSVLLSETAARWLGVGVGDRVTVPGSSLFGRLSDSMFEPTVIGITSDFHVRSLREEIDPVVMGFRAGPIDVIDYFTIRLSGSDMPGTMAHLTSVGEAFDPRHPFEYNFLDARIQDFYDAEIRQGRIFGLATGLAIIIACLGLFGLAAYTTSRRTKEIGVRKVLGATVGQVVVLLSREIVALVGLAFFVAMPVAWWVMDGWLDRFAYRIDVGVGVLLTAGAIALTFGLLTVGYQAVRAALADPVDSLRYE